MKKSSAAIEDKEDSTYAEAEISEEAAESSEDDSEDDEEEKRRGRRSGTIKLNWKFCRERRLTLISITPLTRKSKG